MPKRGGYDSQPLRWRRMISTMNQRYRRAYDRAKAEHYPDEDEERSARNGGRREVELDPSEFMSSPFADTGGRPSWEQFAHT